MINSVNWRMHYPNNKKVTIKKPRISAAFLKQQMRRGTLTLGVLRTFTGLVQTDFLTLHDTCITGHQTSLTQC